MKSNHIRILLILLTLFFAALRIVGLTQLPNILNRDEAALGYNAYLLNETGKDEWGKPWPFALESFGDYKLPGYVLLLVGLFKVVGYSDVLVKIPSLLGGFILICVSFAFTRTYWPNKKYLPFLASLFVSVTPLFFFYSRLGFEAHVALAFVVMALFFWWRIHDKLSAKQHTLFVLVGSLCYLFSCLTYNTPLLLLPVLAGTTIWKIGVQKWKTWLPVTVSMSLVAVVVALQLLPLTKQKSAITIFADPTIQDQWVKHRDSLPNWARPVFGKKIVYLITVVVQNTFESFSPVFLVQKGGAHPWHQTPNASHLGWGLYGLGLIGMVSLLRSKNENKALLLLLIGSLAPAVVTTDAPHVTRSLLFVWAWVMLAVRGYAAVIEYLSKYKKLLPVFSVVVVSLLLLEFSWYVRQYWTSYPAASALSLKAGFDTEIQKLESSNVESVAIVDPEGYHYILAAWYAKMSPEFFFSTQVRQQPNSIGFKYGERVGKYHFIASPTDRVPTEKVLVQWTGSSWEVTQ